MLERISRHFERIIRRRNAVSEGDALLAFTQGQIGRTKEKISMLSSRVDARGDEQVQLCLNDELIAEERWLETLIGSFNRQRERKS